MTLLAHVYTINSQELSKLIVRKTSDQFFFFQKGEKKDTISKNLHSIFYLIASDSLKKQLLIHIDNARLIASENDSLVKLEYLPGLKYEAWFVKETGHRKGNSKSENTALNIQSFLNGSTSLERSKVRIRILNRKEEGVLLENDFYYWD